MPRKVEKYADLSEDDLKVVKAIRAACEGLGFALWTTIREAVKPSSPGVPNASKKIVDAAWQIAADKIIDVMMED